jgi:hypothetical protein
MEGGTADTVSISIHQNPRLTPEALLSALRPGLDELLQALDLAVLAGRDPWKFAVEIRFLHGLGMTDAQLRWLVCMRYVEHACEITRRHEDGREFQPTGNLMFLKRTCFVLTSLGAAFVRSLKCHRSAPHGDIHELRPVWSREARTLVFDCQVIRQYRWPATNQELILNIFEEAGWPPRVDDPLPCEDELEPKQRLRDTIRNLNAHHLHRVIRFCGDGTGQAICWKRTSETRN